MTLSTIHRFLCAAACFCVQLAVGAQTTNIPHEMNTELKQAIGKMRATRADLEVLRLLEAIQDRKEQATQVLLASNCVLDLEQRSGILSMVFQLPLADDGLNASHIPLLVQLYVNSAKLPLSDQPRPRSFMSDSVLQSRLLDVLGSLLHAESARSSLAPGDALPRLLGLLEGARSSQDLPSSVREMIEDAVGKLKGSENTGKGSTDEQQFTPVPVTSLNVERMPKAIEAKPTATTPSEEHASSTPWSIIVVLIVAATGLLWLLLKRRS